jgi:hypothetical protein
VVTLTSCPKAGTFLDFYRRLMRVYINKAIKLNTKIYLDSPVPFEVITSELPQKRKMQLVPAE